MTSPLILPDARTGRARVVRRGHPGALVVVAFRPDAGIRLVGVRHAPSRDLGRSEFDTNQGARLIAGLTEIEIGSGLLDVAARDTPIDVVPLPILADLVQDFGGACD